MIYFFATIVGMGILIAGLLIKITGSKGKAVSSCATVKQNEGDEEIYCTSCGESVKDQCLKK